MLRLLAVAFSVSGVVACAASSKSMAPPPPTGTNPRAEIDALDKQIGDELVRMGIEPFTATCAADQSCTADASPPREACANTAPSCSDVCELGESICSNATKICDLAKRLGGMDAYANEKCHHGTESCTAARQRCCDCT